MGEEENSSVDAALVTSACLCPRPAPFSTDSRAVNRVLGNLVVEEDPAFGGGHLLVSGKSRARLHVFLQVPVRALAWETPRPSHCACAADVANPCTLYLLQATRPTHSNFQWLLMTQPSAFSRLQA